MTTSEQHDGELSDALATSKRPFYLADPCPAWCDGFHEEKVTGAGRVHMGTDLMTEVVLSTEDPAAIGEKPHTLADYFPVELVVYVDQHVREVSPRVAIDGIPAERTQLHFLAAEARQVGEALIRLAEVAGG